jgi:hypothetical protein
VKLTLRILDGHRDGKQRRWSHLFGGRIRTTTFLLIVAFLLVWRVYDTYRPERSANPPAPQVVPPGFVPDPNYTWVPRSLVQHPPAPVTVTVTVTVTPTPTTTVPPSTTTPPPVTTPTTPPPFVPPQLPCLLPPPFCPPSTSPPTSPPQLTPPAPGPVTSSPPPAS